MGVTKERKREIEKELAVMAVKLREISGELESSIHIDGTYYSWSKDSGVTVTRFFYGYDSPGLVEREAGESFEGFLSIKPQGRRTVR